MDLDGERRARVALSFLAKPGDPVLGAALRTRTATEVLVVRQPRGGRDGRGPRRAPRWRGVRRRRRYEIPTALTRP